MIAVYVLVIFVLENISYFIYLFKSNNNNKISNSDSLFKVYNISKHYRRNIYKTI